MAYADPRPGLPLSPLMQRALDGALRDTVLSPKAKGKLSEIRKVVADIVTKPPAVTEIALRISVTKPVTEKKRGRPKANGLSAVERMRKMRAKKNG